jgi:protein TonB
MFLLADAYSRARRNTAAISVIEQRLREVDQPLPKWQILDLQVRCDAGQYRACAERLLALVESGRLRPGWPELLAEYASGLAELPETREMLLQAQAQGQFTSAWAPSSKPIQVIRDAQTIYRLAPDYPYRAKALGLSGWVLAEVDVGSEGEVLSVQVVESDPEGEFEQAAETALRKWRFVPMTVDGVAEPFTSEVKLVFQLHD